MARRGSVSRLRKHAGKAFNKVARKSGGRACGTSPRGSRNRVCLSTHPVSGMACGRNPVNGLWACANAGRGRRRGRR